MTALDAPLAGRVAPAGGAAGTLRAGIAVGAVVALCAAAVALHVHNGSSELTAWCYGNVVLALVLLVPGALLLAHRPSNPIGWLICVSCFAQGTTGFGRDYFLFGASGGTAPGWRWIGWLGDAGWLLSTALVAVIIVLFPDQPLTSLRARIPVAITGCCALLALAGYLLDQQWPVTVDGRTIRFPASDWLPDAAQNALGLGAQLMLALGVLYAVVVFARRYHRTTGEQRAQYRWTVWAGSIGLVELVTEFFPINPWAVVTGPAMQALLAAAVTLAILRHRLFDIDVVLNRTLLFAVLTALVALLYIGAVTVADLVLRDRSELGPGLIAAGLVVAVLTPSRSWVQRRVDRLVYGARHDPYRALSALGSRLADDAESQLDVVVHTVREALRLPYVAIRDVAGRTLAESGGATRPLRERPLTYRSATVGTLVVQDDDGGRDRDAERLLGDLARQAGAAVHTTQLTDDLRASRARLVASKEEERRRLRRDLHDGLGPQLAAVGLKLDAATSLLDSRPDKARGIVDDVRDDIRTTIADIRILVYGLRPPALDELGLAGALRECVQRFDRAGVRPAITVTVAELPPLPAAVEVAAYWIVNEAVTNLVRHADADAGTVELELDAGELVIRVADDGRGLPAGWRPGIGTSSMAERAAELGGTFGVAPCDRGTLVTARLPVDALHE